MKRTQRLNPIARRWQRLRTVPGLGRDVLALALVTAIGLAVGGYILSQQRANWPWEDDFTFTAEFGAAPGVSPGHGQEVRIAGVPVGDIREASLGENGAAKLTLAVSSSTVIYDNARIVLRPKSPLNEMYVTVFPGGPPGKPLPEGGTIPESSTSFPVQPDEVLSHLDDRTRDALRTMLAESDVALANASAHLPEGLDAVRGTLASLRPVAESLETRQAKIRTLVTSLSDIGQAVGGNDLRLARAARSLQRTAGTIASNDTELSSALAELPGFTADLRRAMTGAGGLASQLDPTLRAVDRSAKTLPGALRRFTGTVGHVERTVDRARPLVRAARPVVSELRPLVTDVRHAVDDFVSTSARLDPVTSGLLPYLDDVKAFMAHTASAASVYDANGGFIRAHAVVAPESVPYLPQLIKERPR